MRRAPRATTSRIAATLEQSATKERDVSPRRAAAALIPSALMSIAATLAAMPGETLGDGETIALRRAGDDRHLAGEERRVAEAVHASHLFLGRPVSPTLARATAAIFGKQMRADGFQMGDDRRARREAVAGTEGIEDRPMLRGDLLLFLDGAAEIEPRVVNMRLEVAHRPG